VDVYSKTGTWGPRFADAGIIRHETGKDLVLTVLIESRPAYRGSFIAALARRVPQLSNNRGRATKETLIYSRFLRHRDVTPLSTHARR
jgi:hypothetical protein